MRETTLSVVLFTDIVASTELGQRLGDERYEDVRRGHFTSVREAISEHRGDEVKTQGDGFMVVFRNPSDALDCAVTIQRAVELDARRTGVAVGVRIGVHLGEVTVEDGDYYGTSVVIADRLCRSASGGQILISDALRVVAGASRHAFARIGDLELKGISEPVATCELTWEPARSPKVPFPSGLLLGAGTPFAGRADDVDRIHDSWAVAGMHRHLVLISGEPGIGKTRLSAEFARAAHEQGANVLFGRCSEEPLAPYQPFLEAIGHLVGSPVVDEVRDALGPHAAHLSSIAPELAPVDHDRRPGEGDRYLLFEAVAELFAVTAANAPTVVVLDDLHWADKPTLLLLSHVMQRHDAAQLLVVGTYRETELARTHPLADLLADLRRDVSVERIRLRGLDVDDVADLLIAMAQHDVGGRGRALAHALEQTTDGNPFFIQEIVRHLVETGHIYQRDGVWRFDVVVDDLGIPEGVKEVIGRRLSRLSERTNITLGKASVLGREFRSDVLAAMVDDGDSIVDSLDEALTSQLIQHQGAASGPMYVFSHALVKQTLYDELSIPRRQQLHLRAAGAIERSFERDIDAHVAELALHYRTAGVAADPAKTIAYTVRAGERALDSLAYEEAHRHWVSALEVMNETDVEPLELARHLERLGDLVYVSDIDYAKGIEYLEQALALYQQTAQDQKAAQIHSRLGRALTSKVGGQDIPRATDHFRAAEAILLRGPERASLGYVYTGMSSIALNRATTAEGLETSLRAMAIGERLGNQMLWVNAAILNAWHVVASGHPRRGIDLFDRAWAIADEANAGFGAYLASWLGGLTLSQLYDPRAAVDWITRELNTSRLAQAHGQRRFLYGLMIADHARIGQHEAARSASSLSSVESTRLYWDGIWDERLRFVEQDERALHRTGERWNECGRLVAQAWIHEDLGNEDRAIDRLRSALAIIDGQHLANELAIRSRLATLLASRGETEQSATHLERCRDVLAMDDGWRGLPAEVDLADAVLSAARGGSDSAEPMFTRAIAHFDRYSLAMSAADAFAVWSRALSKAGRTTDASRAADESFERWRATGVSDTYLELLFPGGSIRP